MSCITAPLSAFLAHSEPTIARRKSSRPLPWCASVEVAVALVGIPLRSGVVYPHVGSASEYDSAESTMKIRGRVANPQPLLAIREIETHAALRYANTRISM